MPLGSAPTLTEAKRTVWGKKNGKSPGEDALRVELQKIDGLAGDAEPIVLQHFRGIPVRVWNWGGGVPQEESGKTQQPSKCTTRRAIDPTAASTEEFRSSPTPAR